ncbi:MAG: polynucleotide adenylyltransferase PcnB [Candidatus Obscuribacterales bacterium]|nr:polynucleotide adenylyltransferase PcnB [Steroidobacteraceae bacterium]
MRAATGIKGAVLYGAVFLAQALQPNICAESALKTIFFGPSDLEKPRNLSQPTFKPINGDVPVIVPRAEHPVSRSQISPYALKVLYRLKDAGFQGFLVGGAVRDLLLGVIPKDFDIATDAHPEQVKQLFRNCRLIGRRFHLAHVRFGDEIIEVATFRAAHTPIDDDNSVDEGGHRVLDAHGRILRDNLYGHIDEDVWRRDFTANALYYSIQDFSIWDYVGGFADARARVLKLIGDPETRYHEDAVRMLRAVRFAAKLDFSIHPATAEPIARLAGMLDGIPPARLFDEVCKLFLAGFAERAFDLLIHYQLLEHLLPSTARAVANQSSSNAVRLVRLGLQGTDTRVAQDKSVTPTFLFAVLLWPAIKASFEASADAAQNEGQAWYQACEHVVAQQQRRVAVPKRFTVPMTELIALQPRFERRDGRRALRLLEHPRFRAAYDFLLLRAAAGEADAASAEWWTHIQTLAPQERIDLIEGAPVSAASSDAPKRRRRRRKRAAAPQS